MKANQITQSITATSVAPTVIENLNHLLTDLKLANVNSAEHQKRGFELHNFCDLFIRKRYGIFDPDKKARELLYDCQYKGTQSEVTELQAAMDEKEAEYEKAAVQVKKAEVLEVQLRELLKQEGSSFDAQIIETYKAVVARIAKTIRPECASEEEALLVARGLDRPTSLHSCLYSWKQGIDVVRCAENFIRTAESASQLTVNL